MKGQNKIRKNWIMDLYIMIKEALMDKASFDLFFYSLWGIPAKGIVSGIPSIFPML